MQKAKKKLSLEDKQMLEKLELECYRKGITQKPSWDSVAAIKEKNARAIDNLPA